jgi:hypothetical protein
MKKRPNTNRGKKMDPIKCDKCIYLGRRHEKGVIPIQSGATVVDEPYVTCLKYNYFVLEREAERCPEFKEVGKDDSIKPADAPKNPFKSNDILKLFQADTWKSLEELQRELKIESKEKTKYLQLWLRTLVKYGTLAVKIDSGKQYWLLK